MSKIVEQKTENNYVVAEKLMLANVSMTKWNQLECTTSFSVSFESDLFISFPKQKPGFLITCSDFFSFDLFLE